jgi:hypothetical protein
MHATAALSVVSFFGRGDHVLVTVQRIEPGHFDQPLGPPQTYDPNSIGIRGCLLVTLLVVAIGIGVVIAMAVWVG